jgi:hypothetical protein
MHLTHVQQRLIRERAAIKAWSSTTLKHASHSLVINLIISLSIAESLQRQRFLLASSCTDSRWWHLGSLVLLVILLYGWWLRWHALKWLLFTSSTNFRSVLTLMIACVLIVFEWLLGNVRGLWLRVICRGILCSFLMVLMHLLCCLRCLVRIRRLLGATQFRFFSRCRIHMDPVLWMLAIATKPRSLICLRNDRVTSRLMTLCHFIRLRNDCSARRRGAYRTNVEIYFTANIRLRFGWLTCLTVRIL